MFIELGKDTTIALPSARPWIAPLVALSALSLLLGLLYRADLVAAFVTWCISPTYSHCFLILPIALYMVWLRRHELACLRPAPWLPGLLLVIPASIGWMLGRLSAINELQQLSVVGLYQMVLLTTLGPKVYRAILFPALLLFFLVPVGQYLVPPLQHLTTLFVSSGLSALNILHYTEGNVIELENGRFLVAEACAGLRFLIANLVLCVIFAHFVFRRPAKIILFMVAAVLVPIIANGFRALGIVLIAHWTNNRLAVGADHLIYGWGFSVVILLVLFGGAYHFRDEPAQTLPLIRARPREIPATGAGVLVTVLTGLLLFLPVVAAQAQAAAFPANELSLSLSLPQGWNRRAAPPTWSPLLPGAQTQSHWSLQAPAHREVNMAYGYYDDADHPATDLETQFWEEGTFNMVQAQERHEPGATIREIVLVNPKERRLLWWAYLKDGKFITSGMALKLLAIRKAFAPHTGTGVMVLSTRSNGDDEQARSRLRALLGAVKVRTLPAESGL